MQPTRTEFLFFAPWEKALFYVLAMASLAILAAQVWQRVRLWRQGRPNGGPVGREIWVRRVQNLIGYVLLQRRVRTSRPRDGAPMHLLIFYGFLAMLAATTLLAVNTYSPVKFHQGTYYLLFESVFDTLGLLLVAGLVWAIVRRIVLARRGAAMVDGLADKVQAGDPIARQLEQNRRFPLSHSRTDLAALGLLLLIALTGYWLEAARIAAVRQPWDGASWVGDWVAQWLGSVTPGLYKAVWWFHIVLFFAFVIGLPRLRIRHIVMAVLAIADRPDGPMGRLRPVTMEEVEQTEQVGLKLAKDFSRWHLMSLDACMECGRCTEVCPAWHAGKALNPKQLVQDVRSAQGSDAVVAQAIGEDVLWQCTTCSACMEACPVLIRHVDLIVESRRHLVSEGALSGSAAVMLRQTASTGHAWGAQASDREKWMEGLDVPLCRDGVEFDVLFWVGCAGATDPGAVKTTRAVAWLLKQAGVRFACLGREEACTGDPARRVGEEFLFQEKAGANVATFERYGVKKVVTACPHCMNTFKNEYGDFGGNLEVFHHTQLLQELVRKGDLLAAQPTRGEVAYHDPCYLARVNDESDAPREVATGMVDPPNHGSKTRCCGAGGGRMWMEEPPDQRPNLLRAEELLATGAKAVAVGCPFCRIMLDAGLKQAGGDEVRLVDLAEMLQEANPGPGA